jgi:hypothetical protein
MALTPFIGREPELYTFGQFLGNPQCLMLTIVDPGGIGKTCLTVEDARHSTESFPRGGLFRFARRSEFTGSSCTDNR